MMTMEASNGPTTLWTPEPEATVLDQTVDFVLEKAPIRFLENLKGMTGYRIRNKRTDVVELEGTRLAEAIRALHGSQAFLDEVDADPTDKHQRAMREQKLAEFEKLVGDQLP